MHVENGVSEFVVGAVHSYSWAYILAGWSGGSGELSYMCSQTASRCRFFTSTVRRWLGSSNVFPPSLAILFLSPVVQYILVGHMQRCQPRQVQHEDPANHL
jgi:hypothetical protein